MKTLWTQGLEGKDKEDMLQAIRLARMPLGRLEKLTGAFISDLAITLPRDFETPQWALKRAYEDGQIYAYNKILDLLKENNNK